ncbi:MAG: HAMP domain-containing histidine kinase, partial [Anaerolineae bacterium]|nr:HAMP domain-containing histidine kinase [Anaerolineae bacterium]
DLGLGSYLADGLLNMGRLSARQDNHPQAIAYAHEGLAHAQTIQYKGIQMNCHLLLSQSYKHLGEWQPAFQHHEQYTLLKDEIHTEESATKLRHLEVQHRTRQAQMELEAQRKLRDEDRRYYEQLNQMKDEILNTASHDLKSPLVGIQHTLDSLRRHGRIDDPHGQQLMLDIDKTVRQMGDLVTSVLDLAKLETGRALHLETCDFVAFIQSMLPEMTGAAQRAGIDLAMKLPTSAVTLAFDTDRMVQVMQNLLSNAVKYTGHGGNITLTVEVKATHLTVAIKDTGMGIPVFALPYVFERFYRVPDERHRQIDGTGLGLAIVKAIIEQHRGTIQVDSTLNQGTTFTFSLPLL